MIQRMILIVQVVRIMIVIKHIGLVKILIKEFKNITIKYIYTLWITLDNFILI
jgi:hypothetical protein